MRKSRTRALYFFIFLTLIVLEALIALYIHDIFIRPYLGDVIAVIVIYYGVRSIFLNKIPLLPIYIFIFAAFIEMSQYFNLIKLFGLERNKFLVILLGSTFSWEDIICYAVGCLIIFGIDRLKFRN